MGAQLVSLVMKRWTRISDTAFRVLVKMALTALDEPTDTRAAGEYFAGRDPLAEVLDPLDGDRQTVLRRVRYALNELIARGAIKRTSTGRAGKNSEYRLTLLNTPQPIDKPRRNKAKKGEPGVPPQGESQIPPQGEPGIPERGNLAFPPRNHEEPQEEPLEEEVGTLLPVVQAVDTTGGAPPPDPRRTQTAPSSPPGNESTSSISSGEQQPPQPETATHDRAREDAAGLAPILRLIEGNPAATRGDREEPHLTPVRAPIPTRQGFGWCLTCYAEGQTTLAVDDQHGDRCAKHLHTA
ncbi:MAG TPA: hypothetical protein VFR67_06165 [Pilimelia sp.]|nr:hypothetical protein [Pilimelia sp.]